MADLMLKGLDDGLVAALKQRAEASGQSLDHKAGELMKLGLRLDSEGRSAEAKGIRSMSPGPVGRDSTDLIRAMREAG